MKKSLFVMYSLISKIVRGSFAIMAIKIFVIVFAFLFQGCQTGFDVEKNRLDFDEYKSSFLKTSSLLNSIKIDVSTSSKSKIKDNFSSSIYQEYDTETYYLVGQSDQLNHWDDEILHDVESIYDIFGLKNNYNLELLYNVGSENILAAYELPVQPIMDALQPAVFASKQYFYDLGFSESDIIEMLDGEDEATLIPIVMEVTLNESNYDDFLSFNSLFGSQAFARGKVGDCFMEATGISAGVTLVAALTAATIDKTLVKKLVKDAAKKIGGRAIGGIGLAFIVAEFTLCMYDVDIF